MQGRGFLGRPWTTRTAQETKRMGTHTHNNNNKHNTTTTQHKGGHARGSIEKGATCRTNFSLGRRRRQGGGRPRPVPNWL